MATGSRRRFRRRTLLLGVLAIAVVSGLAVVAWTARPSADPVGELVAEPAYVGSTYAFDGVVCVGSVVTSSRVLDVTVEQAPGGTTELVRAPDGPPTLGFPVGAGEAEPVEGLDVPAGRQDCTLRVLLTPDREGPVEAGTLEVTMAYGPGGLLRRTDSVQPDVALSVTGTGPDPRTPVVP